MISFFNTVIGMIGSYIISILMPLIILFFPGIPCNPPMICEPHPVPPPSVIDLLARGTFTYLPGSRVDDKDIVVSPANFQIIDQIARTSQPNSPVNLYGTHLDVRDDFAIHTQLRDIQDGTTAALQLYGAVPIVADEFRIEPSSLRLEVAGTNLTVKVWNGTSQTPILTHTFEFTAPSSGSVDLRITKSQSTLSFLIGGNELGPIPESGVFGSQVWFGADATGGSWRLGTLTARGLNDGTVRAIDTSKKTVAQSQDGLQSLVSKKRPGFAIGTALALAPTVSDEAYAQVAFGGDFGMLTTENALKWQAVEPTEGVYYFQEADSLVDMADRHHMAVHGHTLVFGEANPQWVQDLPMTTIADKQRVADVMTRHITNLVGHYKGRIASWDVVNEPLADYDSFKFKKGDSELRDHLWHRAMGEAYIAKAFAAARDADPLAKLFVNEYGLEADGERWDAFVDLVTRLRSAGVPIDGVGFQAHIFEKGDMIDTGVLTRHIQQLAALGLESRISELDVTADEGVDWQAAQYETVFDTCFREPHCRSLTTWGVSDRYDYFRDDDGSIQQGSDLLWGADMRPTAAVGKIHSLLQV